MVCEWYASGMRVVCECIFWDARGKKVDIILLLCVLRTKMEGI